MIFETGQPDDDFTKAIRKQRAAQAVAAKMAEVRKAAAAVPEELSGAKRISVLVLDGDVVLLVEKGMP